MPRSAGDASASESTATAFLRLEGGATLLLETSWAQWIPHDLCYVTLYGSEGGATIEWGGGPGSYRSLDRGGSCCARYRTRFDADPP